MDRTFLRIASVLCAVLFLFGCAKTPVVDVLASPSATEETQKTAAPAPTAIPVPTATPEPELPAEGGAIFLYGEKHSDPACIARELELWDYFYAQGMRHLFIEDSYFGAEFLNLWMAADNDEILDQIYEDIVGTQAHSELTLLFYHTIKEKNPETVFHGVDVGHQSSTTGKRYLDYLESIGQKDSEAYALAEENSRQGNEFYRLFRSGSGYWEPWLYREQCLAENFRREYDQLGNESIMGIFGAAHAVTSAQADFYFSPDTITMAMMLEESYGSRIRSVNLEYEVYRDYALETMTINGKEYVAERCAVMDLDGYEGYQSQVFWKLLDAYDDFKDCPMHGEKAACSAFPLPIEPCQVYVVDYIKSNGETERQIFRTDEKLLSNHDLYPYAAKEYYDYLLIPEISVEPPGV